MLDVHIVPEGFKEAERLLRGIKGGFETAVSLAINRGLVAGRKVAVMKIKERYAIKSGDLKERGMKIKEATKANPDGTLEAKGPMLPVSLFSAKSTGKGKNRVVKATILKGQRKIIRGAFQTRPGRIMERRQPDRYPIFPVWTIGVPYMVRHQKISELTQETIAKATAKRLDHEVARILKNPNAARLRKLKP